MIDAHNIRAGATAKWETQNSGHSSWDGYGTGDIGFPLWAGPTVGDRVYAVGRVSPSLAIGRTVVDPPRSVDDEILLATSPVDDYTDDITATSPDCASWVRLQARRRRVRRGCRGQVEWKGVP